MTKKTRAPAPSKPPSARTMVEIVALMAELAEIVIEDFFFDPEREDLYASVLRDLKAGKPRELMLHVMRDDIAAGECTMKLFAQNERSWFRVTVSAPGFEVDLEAHWDFASESLNARQARLVKGKPDAVIRGLDEFADVLTDGALSEEEFADLLDSDGDQDDDAPPPPTQADRRRVADIARRLSRQAAVTIPEKDRTWLEETPQSLATVLDLFIEAAARPGAAIAEPVLQAYGILFSLQLEFVRYRIDEGRTWAADMADAVQERMVAVAQAGVIPAEAWMILARTLTQSRVPVSAAMRDRLAAAGLSRDVEALPGNLEQALHQTLEAIVAAGASPFQVIESFSDAAAVMPPPMRCFIATELALSPHAVLRDTLPLFLLDDDASVRRHVAQTLAGAARPDTMSGDTLRRLIAIRNWLTAADRPDLDTAVRTARLAGVQTAPWPAAPVMEEIYASFVDGSSAQSIVFVHRPPRRKGWVGGVLIRHGTGIRDVWTQEDMSRAEIADLLKTVTRELGGIRVDAGYASLAIQHGLASGLSSGTVPPAALLELAEAVGAHDWQDRRLAIAAEIEACWDRLPAADRSPAGVEALLSRTAHWMRGAPVFPSWFEGGPAVEKRYRRVARKQAVSQLLGGELEDHRMVWAERFLLTALCCQASLDQANRDQAAGLFAAARELADGRPLAAIPPMVHIANTTAEAIAAGGR